MLFSSSKRLSRWLVLLVLALVAAPVAAGWWYRATRPEARLQRGRDAVRRGDWEAAEVLADRLEAAGDANRANLLRGESLAARQRWPEALQALNKIFDEGELRVQAAVAAGRCLTEMGDRREAHRVYSWVLSQDKDNADAHRGMAAIAYDLGNLTAALRHLDEVARLDDADGRSYRLKGLVHTYLSQDLEAVAAYREALARDLSPEFRRQVLLEMAERMVKLTRYHEALAALDERKGEGEDDLAALALRGEALVDLGRADEAEKLLDRAVRDYPDSAPLWALRGQIHLARNQGSEAVQTLERAVRLAPGDYKFRFQLALAYAKVGRKADEEEQRRKHQELRQVLDQLSSLSRAAMRKPWDAEIRLKLAELCAKVEENRLAGMWYRAAMACRNPEE
jgi:tetratricopeptide (TPR) repeat protein